MSYFAGFNQHTEIISENLKTLLEQREWTTRVLYPLYIRTRILYALYLFYLCVIKGLQKALHYKMSN